MSKEVTSALVAEISAAKASSSLDTLNDRDVTSAPVALISAAKASSSSDNLVSNEDTVLADAIVPNLVSTEPNLVPTELKSELVAAISEAKSEDTPSM